MQIVDTILFTYNNYKGYDGECPQTEEEYNNLISSQTVFDGTAPTWSEIQTKVSEYVDPRVSGNQKLLDLGLTQAEATALTGYTPPVAE